MNIFLKENKNCIYHHKNKLKNKKLYSLNIIQVIFIQL